MFIFPLKDHFKIAQLRNKAWGMAMQDSPKTPNFILLRNEITIS